MRFGIRSFERWRKSTPIGKQIPQKSHPQSFIKRGTQTTLVRVEIRAKKNGKEKSHQAL